MENNAGDDIERALLDLGVSIKEEIPDDILDVTQNQGSHNNVEASAGPGEPSDGNQEARGEGPDSLASPNASRTTWASARCVFCSTVLSQTEGTPLLMECLHSACESCIKSRLEDRQPTARDFLGAERSTVTCGACRLQCQGALLISQRFVLEASETGVDSGRGQRCSSCDGPDPPTAYCVDCADIICDTCVQAHRRLKITKEHTIKNKEEAMQEMQMATNNKNAQDMYCQEHAQERLTLFCETCERLTCRDCQLTHHRDHKYQFSSEMAAQARSSISALLSEVSYKRVLLGSAMKVIKDRQNLIADKKKSLVHEITQTVVKLTNAINTRGKQLVLRLNEVCDSKQKVLGEKKDALQQLSAITEHCIDFVTAALEQGSDTAVLHSKKTVSRHLQRVKARRADIPNPEIPVRISLQLDALPDLLQVLTNIGGIVVDGKVDGAPHTTHATHAAHPAHTTHPVHTTHPTHSSVAALQQVAMQQQSYMQQCTSSAMLSHLSRRTQHVSSTTHPHHLHGMNEMNLRGLLSPPVTRAHFPRGLAPMQHPYHQMMGAFAAGSVNPAGHSGATPYGGRRALAPAPNAAPSAPHAHAKWHVPQHAHSGVQQSQPSDHSPGPDYKITLSRSHQRHNSAVTSTNPKTPSPSLNTSPLDRVCMESVQDLMATIAKLDSNGVQVLPEHSPRVHSSTDDGPRADRSVPPAEVATSAGAAAGADPNEDWCAVCMDGGELVCCDRCPKVFHQYCHIPTIDKLPQESETWQCLLCVNFSELPPDSESADGALSPRLQKIIERITLEMYCQYEISAPFREPPTSERAVCLDVVRGRLQPGPAAYRHVSHYIQDVRLIFNSAPAHLADDARRMEEFFDAQLAKWLPEHLYWRPPVAATTSGAPTISGPAKRARLSTD